MFNISLYLTRIVREFVFVACFADALGGVGGQCTLRKRTKQRRKSRTRTRYKSTEKVPAWHWRRLKVTGVRFPRWQTFGIPVAEARAWVWQLQNLFALPRSMEEKWKHQSTHCTVSGYISIKRLLKKSRLMWLSLIVSCVWATPCVSLLQIRMFGLDALLWLEATQIYSDQQDRQCMPSGGGFASLWYQLLMTFGEAIKDRLWSRGEGRVVFCTYCSSYFWTTY